MVYLAPTKSFSQPSPDTAVLAVFTLREHRPTTQKVTRTY